MLPFQFGINSALAGYLDSPLRATLVSYVVGTAVLVLATLAFVRGWPGGGPRRSAVVVGRCALAVAPAAPNARRPTRALRM